MSDTCKDCCIFIDTTKVLLCERHRLVDELAEAAREWHMIAHGAKGKEWPWMCGEREGDCPTADALDRYDRAKTPQEKNDGL